MIFSYIILGLCLCQALPLISAKTYKCNSPKKGVLNQLNVHHKVKKIKEHELVFTYDYKECFIQESAVDFEEFAFNHLNVHFAGHVVRLDKKGKEETVFIKKDFDTKKVSVRQFIKGKKECVIAGDADYLKVPFPDAEQSMVNDLTSACLVEFICEKAKKFSNSCAGRHIHAGGNIKPQHVLNGIFDAIMAFGLKNTLDNNNRFVYPTIRLDAPLKAGHIVADQIIVKGLKSLQRTRDALFHRRGHRYEVNTGLKIENLVAEAPHYEGQIVKPIDGKFDITLPKSKVNVKVIIDYNSRQCKIDVEITKDKIEKPKIKITGIGKLNVPLAWLGEWGVNFFFNYIVRQLTDSIKGFDCEQYRDVIESAKL